MSRADEERPEEVLFFRRWLANPMKVGAVLPSSPQLARLLAKQARPGPDQCIVELGPGTGPVTKALLANGIPAERLFVVEIDPKLCEYLRREFPNVSVIQGDARNLKALLPAEWVGKVACVVSGIPMLPLPVEVQRGLTRAAFDVMAPGGQIVQYTYSPASPIKTKALGLIGRRMGIAMLNFPPAWVWGYLPEPKQATV
ncbi:MAG: methyltransferase domain-containing protein [Alphaproteobacteria bacterium]|nr:methyltransferase domain-containing protein [Alphaproteobacteria bacterium]